jgi:arylsulfatase A-like enzyme
VAKPSPILRVLLATLSGFLFTMFVICVAYSWRDAGAQRWETLGYDWLVYDLWARAWEIKEAAAGAGLTLALALLAEKLVGSQFAIGRLLVWGQQLAAKPAIVVGLALLTFAVPPLVASMTRPATPEGAKNVVYVMVDTWRADHVGWMGYDRPVTPKLDPLVRSGVVFERAVSASSWTKPSVATQLTGLLPSVHGAVSQPMSGVAVNGTMLPPDMTTWVETLRARGWETGMFSNNPNILPSHGFDQGAAHFVDYVNHPDRKGELQQEDAIDPGRAEFMLPDAREWIDAQAESGNRFAAYIHLMDPHYPFVAPAPFKGTFDKTGSDFQLDGHLCGQWIDGSLPRVDIGPLELERIKAIYDEEILYTDHYVAPFIEGILRDYPDTVVVLVSDHGEEFLEHGQIGHSQSLYAELVNVPLVIWAPQLEPARIEWQVRSYDLLPTLLELAGAARGEGDEPLFGTSLVGMQDGHRVALMEVGGDERPPWHWRAVSDGEWKMVERLENRPDKSETWVSKPIPSLSPREADGLPFNELFQVSTDRMEMQDRWKDETARGRALKNLGIEEIRSLYSQPSSLADRWFGTEHIFEFGTKSGGLGADPDHLGKLGYEPRH